MWAVFLCAGPCRGIMPLKRRTGRAASRGKTPLPDSTGPCSGIMPLKRRTGRAASRGKTPLLDSQGRTEEIAADAACAPPSGRETVLN